MEWSIQQVFDELIVRVREGPMQFRFILQPAMAAALGIRDGLADCRAGAPPLLTTLFSRGFGGMPWKKLLLRLCTPILVATAIDAVVQVLMFGHVRPLSALIVGTTLMAFPYCGARGLSNRLRMRPGRPLFRAR
jgi:hypothetical protein